jgi:hypothetical protein
VGTRVLPLIAQSMNLPLFTRDIKGKAVSRGPEYGSRYSSGEGSEVTGDETEDLYMLIKKIKVSRDMSDGVWADELGGTSRSDCSRFWGYFIELSTITN